MQRNSRKASSGRRLKFQLGVDIGGTFTDLVLSELDGGRQFVGKVLTTYEDLASGVLHGIHRLLAQSGVLASDISKVVHGTTLATNALIERRGPKAAMVVTRGFRDVLEMARESRYDIFDIDLRVPIPLIPRRLVFEVSERIDAQGLIVEQLDGDEVRKI